jgi:hypothetical protein
MTAKANRAGSMRANGPVALAAGLEKSLSAYASAAAVGLLALSQTAEARIVYTPAHIEILVGGGPVKLDLNHDGIGDFIFSNFWSYSGEGRDFWGLYVACSFHGVGRSSATCNYQTNQIWGRGVVSGRFASALPRGFTVRASKPYFQQALKAHHGYMPEIPAANMGTGAGFYGSTSTRGQWTDSKNRYLGLQFVIKEQVHYGWARLTVTYPQQGQEGLTVVLTGYAYETIPNKPIITGKTNGPDVITLDPATLGHLAQGASQIPAWRVVRNKSAAAEGSR